MKWLILIAARQGSKGLRHKNIRKLGGTPLLVRAIELARKSLPHATVVVSTDSVRYAQMAKRAGALVPFLRPKALAKDNTRLIEVVLHALAALQTQGHQFDAVMLLSATTPFTLMKDVRAAARLFAKNPAHAVVSVTPERTHPSWRFSLIRGYLNVAERGSSGRVRQRQTAAQNLVLNGAIYLATPAWLLRFRQFFVAKKTLPYVMPAARSLDIESLDDLRTAQRLV